MPAVGRSIDLQHFDRAGRHSERRSDRVGQPLPIPLPDGQPVHDHRDVMVGAALQAGRIAELHQLAVHSRPHEALPDRFLEQVAELPLSPPHQGSENLDPRSLRPGKDLFGNLGGRLRANRPAAVGAVGSASPRPQEAEVVVDLGDRAHRRARIPARAPLLDRDRRGEPLDLIHIRLLENAQELPGIRRERLHVSALPLGVNRVEDER
jgi:hypothetical protein